MQVSGWDGRRGWVRTWSLRLVGRTAARRWEGRAGLIVRGHGAIALGVDGRQQPLPWGARLVALGRDGGRHLVQLPDGRRAFLRSAHVRSWRSSVPPAERVIDTARQGLGSPYLWGGTTPWGFDCSGLVQWAFALNGVALSRDAEEQWRELEPVTTAVEPGDLLFFGRRGIQHVALVTRPPWFLHAHGKVEETTMRASGRPELAPLLVGAARPLSGRRHQHRVTGTVAGR